MLAVVSRCPLEIFLASWSYEGDVRWVYKRAEPQRTVRGMPFYIGVQLMVPSPAAAAGLVGFRVVIVGGHDVGKEERNWRETYGELKAWECSVMNLPVYN